MKFFRFAAFAAMALSMLMFASCDQKDDPTPEPIVPIDVFFSAENGDYCYYAAPGTATEVNLKLVRTDVEKEATINIKVNDASNGITIPETVKFAAGESETTVKITTPANGVALDKYDFDITLSGDYVNPSATSDLGTIRCEGTVYIYEEVTAVGSFGAKAFDYLGYFKQKIWRLADNKMIMKGFLGSDEDLSFTYSKTMGKYGYGIDALDFSNKDYEDKEEETNSDYLGSTYYYFWKSLADDPNGEYYSFAPKGDQRYVAGLGLYVGNEYSGYVKDETYDYLFFTCPYVYFYGESEGIEKGFEWIYYLYFSFVSEEKLANYDFVTFPEITPVTYPDPVSDVTVPDGCVKMEVYFDEEKLYSDSQVASVVATESGEDYTIANFLGTDNTIILHVLADGDLTFEVLDKDGNELSYEYTYSGYNYRSFGVEQFYPWSVDKNWYVYNMDSVVGYNGWYEDEDGKYAYCYVYYDICNDDEGIDVESGGYLYFMW